MPNEYFATDQEITKTADAIRRKKRNSNLIEWKNNTGFQDAIDSIEDTVVYGFHINSNESDPSAAVTYLADAIGKTPAHMDYDSGTFDYGSWENAFFMPKPCMLKYNGTVDYYLDPNDYSKKLDGTASDVTDDTYDGNAMMEWGQNGKKIWYKIIPDANDNTSASIYIADHQADEGFHAWSFYDYNNTLKDHFYTPIYNGSIDSNGKLRSISGKAYSDLCQDKTAAEEITAAELNNIGSNKGWYTEVYADIILIQFLCYLIGKSLDVQTVFGNGRTNQPFDASSMLGTGTMDDKGLFWGSNENNYGVKVFGMENFWANQYRRYAGHYLDSYINKYKLTRGTADGSSASDYSTSSATGYLNDGTSPSSNGYYSKCTFNNRGGIFIGSVTGGSSTTYYCDYFYQNSGRRYPLHGGRCDSGAPCGFSVYASAGDTVIHWYFGASLSYK